MSVNKEWRKDFNMFINIADCYDYYDNADGHDNSDGHNNSEGTVNNEVNPVAPIKPATPISNIVNTVLNNKPTSYLSAWNHNNIKVFNDLKSFIQDKELVFVGLVRILI